MRATLIILLLAIAGCAAPRGPEVYEGNSASVIVGWNRSTQGTTGALEAADAHCKKFGKAARYTGKPNAYLLAYDCVQP